MKIAKLIPIATVVLMSGCATPIEVLDYYDADSATLAKLRHMELVGEEVLLSDDYEDLGDVKGLFCEKSPWDPEASSDSAMNRTVEQLKLRAAAKGADYISAPSCTLNNKMDLTNNCWSTLICSSHALIASAE